MKVEDSYIEYANGFSKDVITMKDIQKAIIDIADMEENYGAFWVGVIVEGLDNEITMEAHQDHMVIVQFAEGKANEFTKQLDSAQEVEQYFTLLMSGNIEELKEKMGCI
ncbi:hypothetical protein V6R21_02975 [Limibacter armeniacum]|uniref:hypothetical protein n=1 Tax=Limibacter armeniacum TaxID=466084 RepID=UPI002FE5B548